MGRQEELSSLRVFTVHQGINRHSASSDSLTYRALQKLLTYITFSRWRLVQRGTGRGWYIRPRPHITVTL